MSNKTKLFRRGGGGGVVIDVMSAPIWKRNILYWLYDNIIVLEKQWKPALPMLFQFQQAKKTHQVGPRVLLWVPPAVNAFTVKHEIFVSLVVDKKSTNLSSHKLVFLH